MNLLTTFKNWFKADRKEDGIEKGPHIAGHQFWVLDYPLRHSTLRKLSYNKAWREASLSVNEEDLKVIASSLVQAVNDKDLATCGWIAKTLEAQIDLHITKENVFKMGACVILVDDEPADKITGKHFNLKRTLFDTVPEVEAFFLNTVEGILQNTRILSKNFSLGDYLDRQVVVKTDQHFKTLLEKIGKGTGISQQDTKKT